MRPSLVLDIETIPDDPFYRQVHPEAQGGENTSEGRGLHKPLFHQVVAISVCYLGPDGGVEQLKALAPGEDEVVLLRHFWEGLARLAQVSPPRLITFNGRRFDLPVLVQRALLHGVAPTPYWQGEYRQRYRDNHLDLMDFLSDYGASTPLSQHELASLLGVPGKIGPSGEDVLPMWNAGHKDEIAAYCTLDVATLTLCFGRLGTFAGWTTAEETDRLSSTLRQHLEALAPSHPLYQAWLAAKDRPIS